MNFENSIQFCLLLNFIKWQWKALVNTLCCCCWWLLEYECENEWCLLILSICWFGSCSWKWWIWWWCAGGGGDTSTYTHIHAYLFTDACCWCARLSCTPQAALILRCCWWVRWADVSPRQWQCAYVTRHFEYATISNS